MCFHFGTSQCVKEMRATKISIMLKDELFASIIVLIFLSAVRVDSLYFSCAVISCQLYGIRRICHWSRYHPTTIISLLPSSSLLPSHAIHIFTHSHFALSFQQQITLVLSKMNFRFNHPSTVTYSVSKKMLVDRHLIESKTSFLRRSIYTTHENLTA